MKNRKYDIRSTVAIPALPPYEITHCAAYTMTGMPLFGSDGQPPHQEMATAGDNGGGKALLLRERKLTIPQASKIIGVCETYYTGSLRLATFPFSGSPERRC